MWQWDVKRLRHQILSSRGSGEPPQTLPVGIVRLFHGDFWPFIYLTSKCCFKVALWNYFGRLLISSYVFPKSLTILYENGFLFSSEIGITGKQLIFPKITRYASDLYICRATNAHGQVERRIHVSVKCNYCFMFKIPCVTRSILH